MDFNGAIPLFTSNVYIAGPMSGYPDHNRVAFEAAGKRLIDNGFPEDQIFNPIEHEYSKRVQAGEFSGEEAYRKCMRIDCTWICDHANALIMLPGWENSKGAQVEYKLALALGLDIYYWREL